MFEETSNWIIIGIAVLGVSAAIVAFFKTPLGKREMEVLGRNRGNPNLQIAFGVLWLLIALGQLAINWQKIIWNWPLVIVLVFSMGGIIYILTGVEAKIRKSKNKNAQKTEF